MLFNYVKMRAHNLWKMLTQQKVKIVKMKTDQSKLCFENMMAVLLDNVADVLMLFW